jgi:hypothetical protein
MLNALKEHEGLEENWAADNKEPDYLSITLDLPLAAKAFKKIKAILTRGRMGDPLVYVIGHQLIMEDKDDNPPFGAEDTKYNFIDQDTFACPPSWPTMLITPKNTRPSRPMDLVSLPSLLTQSRFRKSFMRVSPLQVHGNM